MPVIKDFTAYKVTLYAVNHNPPHVIGPDFEAKVHIVVDIGKSSEVAGEVE
jgi:hypothetical protein